MSTILGNFSKLSINFSIEGEWLTEVARQKYWYEEESYDKVFAWLKNCLCPCDGSETEAFSEQVDRIVDGILKGELKLTGVNQFEVEEDNAQEEYNAKIDATVVADYTETFTSVNESTIEIYPPTIS